ncbi:MAG: DUF2804 domain-containing protein [Desulfobulbaceae bacterium]|nr:DUF2804 domain-containing protein [Desulfobulbaceae bacterium]
MYKLAIKLSMIFILFYPSFSNADKAMQLMLGEFDAHSRNERIELAVDILNYINKLANYLPTQKPSEIEWVNKELNSIHKLDDKEAAFSRMVDLRFTPEYSHRESSNLFMQINNALKCAANKESEIKQEMSCWALAGLLMKNPEIEDSLKILLDSGRIPKDIEKNMYGGDITRFAQWLAIYEKGIYEYILVPYLANKIQ